MIGSARFSRSYGFTHGSIELQPAADERRRTDRTNKPRMRMRLHSLTYSFSIERICVR